MKIRQLVITGAALLLASPLFATTYFGGVEDWNGLDYDYNDVVFSLNSNSLTLNSATGQVVRRTGFRHLGYPILESFLPGCAER